MEITNIFFDLAAFSAGINLKWAEKFHRKGLRFNIDLPERLHISIYGDPITIRQILSSLIQNALTYTEEGNVELKISRHRQKDKKFILTFELIDSGAGIKPKTPKR